MMDLIAISPPYPKQSCLLREPFFIIMGASASKPDTSGQKSGEDRMKDLNRTLLNKIENPIGSTDQQQSSSSEKGNWNGSLVPSLDRQDYLDSSIQGKIRQELSRLRKQEADMQKQIEQALEKESLDRASQSETKDLKAKGKSSILLRQELDDVRSKIERHNQRRAKVDKAPGVKEARDKVLHCYSTNPDKTLECWAEVRNFRNAVARAESDFVASLST